MNVRKIDAAAFVIGSAVGLYLAHQFINKIAEPHRKEREKIREAVQDELLVIGRSSGVILERIRNGTYAGKSLHEIQELAEFEKIAVREEMFPTPTEGI